MLIADTNVIVPLFINSELSEKSTHLSRRDRDWHLPSWWQIEFANVMRNLHRAKRIDDHEAETALQAALHFLPPKNTHQVDLTETLRIACEQNISAYDACFVALARNLGCSLVTEDRRLRVACPEDTLSLDEALATGQS